MLHSPLTAKGITCILNEIKANPTNSLIGATGGAGQLMGPLGHRPGTILSSLNSESLVLAGREEDVQPLCCASVPSAHRRE